MGEIVGMDSMEPEILDGDQWILDGFSLSLDWLFGEHVQERPIFTTGKSMVSCKLSHPILCRILSK